jgi:transcriptional regulator with XRE-family HTH domain
MAGVHPIMATLREKRIERGMTLSKLARVANLSRESIRKREGRKFPALTVLDRWCRALGYKLTPDRDRPAAPESVISKRPAPDEVSPPILPGTWPISSDSQTNT